MTFWPFYLVLLIAIVLIWVGFWQLDENDKLRQEKATLEAENATLREWHMEERMRRAEKWEGLA